MRSRSGLERCWIKEEWLGSLIRNGMLKQSLGLLINFKKQSSSTKCVLRALRLGQG